VSVVSHRITLLTTETSSFLEYKGSDRVVVLNKPPARVDRAWCQRLKLHYDELVSSFIFNFNFNSTCAFYNMGQHAGGPRGAVAGAVPRSDGSDADVVHEPARVRRSRRQGLTLVNFSSQPETFVSLKPPSTSNKKCLR